MLLSILLGGIGVGVLYFFIQGINSTVEKSKGYEFTTEAEEHLSDISSCFWGFLPTDTAWKMDVDSWKNKKLKRFIRRNTRELKPNIIEMALALALKDIEEGKEGSEVIALMKRKAEVFLSEYNLLFAKQG